MEGNEMQMGLYDEIEFSHVDYGEVSSYIEDRGFGFVQASLKSLNSSSEQEIFFHATKIKAFYKAIGVNIDRVTSDDVFKKELNGIFWYEYETTVKGFAVKRIISLDQLRKLKDVLLDRITSRQIVDSYAKTIKSKCNLAVVDLIGSVFGEDVTYELKNVRDCYLKRQEKKRIQAEYRRKKEIERKKAEYEKYLKIHEKQIKQFIEENDIYICFDEGEKRFELCNDKIEYITKKLPNWNIRFKGSPEDREFFFTRVQIVNKKRQAIEHEFNALVEEVKPLGFTESAEVSRYIVSHSLAKKYRNLSGYLELRKDQSEYTFVGGIDKIYYARLCQVLGLGNRNSGAKVIGFTSFAEAQEKLHKT